MDVKELFSLKGKSALVTGASEWLGYDMAAALSEAGASVIISSRDKSRAGAAAEKLSRQTGGAAYGIALDQASYSGVLRGLEDALAWKGGIDIWVNNAGGGSGSSEGNLFRRSPGDIASMISINLTGVIYCCKAAGEHMASRGSGKIINIASIAALVGRDRSLYRDTNKMEQPVDYAAAKAGILGLTRDMAAYMAPYNVQVNCISPGGFDKGDMPDAFVKGYAQRTAQKRMGRFGSDIKGPVLFLAGAASDYMTGQNLVVDGGFTLWK